FWTPILSEPGATGDFDGNGIPDLAIGTFVFSALCVIDGRGDGSFGGVRDVTEVPGAFRGLATGDFDGDGKPDATSGVADGSLDFAHGNGDGTFAPVVAKMQGLQRYDHLAAGRFDGDGVLDLAGINLSAPSLSYLRGHGDATF